MTPALYWKYLIRESRGSRGRLLFFVLCLAVGVAAVVAVASLSDSLDGAIRQEARKLLSADLEVESRRPLPPELEAMLAPIEGLQRVQVHEMPTVVALPGDGDRARASQLVELKVVDGPYPFYGELELEPDRPLGELLQEGAVVGPDLLQRLGVEVGDILTVGTHRLPIVAVVHDEPDRLSFAFTLGPRVFLDATAFAASGLEAFGSRIERRLLLRLPESISEAEIEPLAERLREALPTSGFYRVETYADAQPALRRSLNRIERYLGLVALVSLLAGGIGVAQTVRAWIEGRLDSIAILKCLGLTGPQVISVYLGQTALLGLVGSLFGALAGLAVPLIVPSLLGDLLPAEAIQLWQPAAVLRGMILGTGVALLFSLPPLLSVRRIPPVRVLRRGAAPLPADRRTLLAITLALGLGITLVATAQSRDLILGFGFAAGLGLVAGLLSLAAYGLAQAAAAIPRERVRRFWLRHGLAALGRPGAGTIGAVVALGLGITVVLAMALVEQHLSGELNAELPEQAPNAFLVDIQPDQWDGVRQLLESQQASSIDSDPVVMARLTHLDGRTVQEITEERAQQEGRGNWALTKEQRLTYAEQLPADNVIIEGALWDRPELDEISLEADFAESLGVGLGSTMTLDVQGVPLELTVSSLRTVDWESFGLNFFMVVEPQALEAAPQFRVAAARLPQGGEQELQNALAASFPNVTVIQLREILEKVSAVLQRLGLGVRFLGTFTVLAGLAILAGAIAASTSRRGREVALVKTLGLTRGGVLAAFAVEYALTGLLAGLIGTVAGGTLAWAVLTFALEIPWEFSPAPFLIALATGALLAAGAGCAASLRALTQRPVAVLRAEG
ncbi:MAG: FtsX-like permease family protein [Acidobacteriota bacterium]